MTTPSDSKDQKYFKLQLLHQKQIVSLASLKLRTTVLLQQYSANTGRFKNFWN